MKSYRSIELAAEVVPGDVLLIGCAGGDFKVIANGEDETLCMPMYSLFADGDSEEEYIGNFLLTNITVGKPLCGLSAPERSIVDGTLRLQEKLETEVVESIELYSVN